MTASDFASFTQNGALCDEEGQLGPTEFERVMRYHIRHLTQSKLALGSEARTPEEEDFVQSCSLRVILMEQTRAERGLEDIKLLVQQLVAPVASSREHVDSNSKAWPRSLEVTVLAARHLPKMDTFGSIDPFCEVSLGGSSFKTSVKKGTYSPDWGESFVFTMLEGVNTGLPLNITLFDWDLVGENDRVGGAVVPAERIRDAMAKETGWSEEGSWAVLRDSQPVVGRDKQAAELQIRLRVLEGVPLPGAAQPGSFRGSVCGVNSSSAGEAAELLSGHRTKVGRNSAFLANSAVGILSGRRYSCSEPLSEGPTSPASLSAEPRRVPSAASDSTSSSLKLLVSQDSERPTWHTASNGTGLGLQAGLNVGLKPVLEVSKVLKQHLFQVHGLPEFKYSECQTDQSQPS